MTKKEFNDKVKVKIHARFNGGKIVNMNTFRLDTFPNNWATRVIVIENNVVWGYTAYQNNDDSINVKAGEVLGV